MNHAIVTALLSNVDDPIGSTTNSLVQNFLQVQRNIWQVQMI